MLNTFWKFFIIDNFGATSTLVTGLVAWSVYRSQKKDTKMNAARIILSEIRLAEERIEQVKDCLNRQISDYPHVLPNNSWNIHSHLFAQDFDRDELDEINKFYDLCALLEDAIKRDANYFWITADSITQVGQQMATRLVYDSLDKNCKIDFPKLDKLKNAVLGNIANNPFIYSPQKTLNILKNNTASFKKITTSVTGKRIKELANI